MFFLAGLFDEELEERQVFGLVVEPFGVPLDSGKKGKRGIFEGFDHAIRGGGDDAEIAADLVHRLLVIGVGDDLAVADGLGEQRNTRADRMRGSTRLIVLMGRGGKDDSRRLR